VWQLSKKADFIEMESRIVTGTYGEEYKEEEDGERMANG
jgi:hypothetical protein